MPEPAPEAEPRAFAAVAVGDAASLAGEVAALCGSGGVILLLPPLPTPPPVARLVRLLEESCASPGTPSPVKLRPAGGLAVGLGAAGAWETRPTAPGADRFHEAVLPRRLGAGRPIAVSVIGGGFATSPCGLLASFAHPRQRLALRLGGDPAPAAELAAAVPLRAAILAGEREGVPLTAVCSTLLAAQLLWRALQPRGPGAERAGPWEEPETQRLTALDQAPRLPSDLAIAIHGAHPAAAALARQLRDRLGDISMRETSH